VFDFLLEMLTFFDFGLIDWWAGLNRGLRLSIALAFVIAGGLVWLLGGSWFWFVPLLIVGVILLIAAIEIRGG
jgi:hypothetical protein